MTSRRTTTSVAAVALLCVGLVGGCSGPDGEASDGGSSQGAGEESGAGQEGTEGSEGNGQEGPSFADKAEMAGWIGSSADELTSLGASIAGLATAAQGGDLQQAQAQLDTIEADVAALRENPAPDPAIDDPLQELLTTVSEGSATVREGIEQQDLATVQEGAQSFADAQTDLDELLQAAQEFATG